MNRAKLSVKASIAFSGNGGYAGTRSLGYAVRKREKLNARVSTYNRFRPDNGVFLVGDLSLAPDAIIAEVCAHSGEDADIESFLDWLEISDPELAGEWRICGGNELADPSVDSGEATRVCSEDPSVAGSDRDESSRDDCVPNEGSPPGPADPDASVTHPQGAARCAIAAGRYSVEAVDVQARTPDSEEAAQEQAVAAGDEMISGEPPSLQLPASVASVVKRADHDQPTRDNEGDDDCGTDVNGVGDCVNGIRTESTELRGREDVDAAQHGRVRSGGGLSGPSLQLAGQEQVDHATVWLFAKQPGLLIQGKEGLLFVAVDDEEERESLLKSPASGTFLAAGVGVLVRYVEAEE